MPRKLCAGNYVAGYCLAVAGEANRDARGCVAGGYPITPQTEIIEFLRGFRFTKGIVQAVESEHSAMAMCLGASLAGARTFTASSSNGLAYMTENVFMAGYLRLPVVMAAVNRTLGPPWNIWADQGDTLALRDAAWLQFYCESHQDVCDTILMAFRVAEDARVLLPAMVAYDGFLISHTSTGVDLPTQAEVDRYLPPCNLPHRLNHDRPQLVGAIMTAEDTAAHRIELEQAMSRAWPVLEEAREEFCEVFGRLPDGAVAPWRLEDADTVLVACNSIASTVRSVVDSRRQRGERVGMVKLKVFRPFPRAQLREALAGAKRVGVIDRDLSPGCGGVFWLETAAALAGGGPTLVQNYLLGLGGGDVTPEDIGKIFDDLQRRREAGEPQFCSLAYDDELRS
jgi:pyruvate/2-oxoacid:ferredoxin oxidoreductase alpha subunit